MNNDCKTRHITLADRALIDRAREISRNTLSSHAFQSLFLWQKQMKLEIYADDDFFAVKCGARGGNTWFCPCGSEDKVCGFVEKKLGEADFSLIYVSEADKARLCERFGGSLAFSPTPCDDEYIYDISGHKTLLGGKYANMRTQTHKLFREYDVSVKPLCADTLPDAEFVIGEWEKGVHGYDESVLNDEGVDGEILKYADELDITGTVMYLNGRPSAVSAGFALTDDTFDIALSKTVGNIQGLSYCSKRELMLGLCGSYKYMNLEEDLGISGLANMKKLMNPVCRNKTWEAKGH